jgi:predicted dehydrogenase
MIRVAIVGCGKVADKHASQVLRIPDARLVGACDREVLMAAQLAERFGIDGHFDELAAMLATVRPDVVHITTPPASHHALAKQCLEAGCHVYVEKPFTLRLDEAVELIDLAEARGLKLTVGHETQFAPVANDMRRLIAAGYLGGPAVHMESVYCYEFADRNYARAMLGDAGHWVRGLPGGLLQNIISHGIGKIAEYLPSDDVEVTARGFTSAFLREMGEDAIVDELRVIVVDAAGTTAYFTFSSQMSPSRHEFAVYGPRNSLLADHEHQTLTRLRKAGYRSYLNQFVPPLGLGRQQTSNGLRNMARFLRGQLHTDHGIHCLIAAFYRSLGGDVPVPVPYRDILLTARIMDEIFRQIGAGAGCSPQAAQAHAPP